MYSEKQIECPSCLGLGIIPVFNPPMPCPDCNGRGYITVDDEDCKSE